LADLRVRGDIFACGAAFAAQEAPHIPTDQYDQRLDGILTDQYFRTF
jgi:5-formyltetrahydrofolate cyclo-ligase